MNQTYPLRRARHRLRPLAVAACLLAACPVHAVELRLLDCFSGTFPARTTVWRVQANAAASVAFTWQLTLGGAVVDRGRFLSDATKASQPIEIPVRIPPLREGVTGQGTLIIEATVEGQSARLVHPIWILPVDPWSGLRTELARNTPVLFENGDALSAKLSSAGLKTAPLRNATAIVSSFLISAERRQPEAVWSAGAAGWAWLDLDLRGGGCGRLLAVGWAPAQAWESSLGTAPCSGGLDSARFGMTIAR